MPRKPVLPKLPKLHADAERIDLGDLFKVENWPLVDPHTRTVIWREVRWFRVGDDGVARQTWAPAQSVRTEDGA